MDNYRNKRDYRVKQYRFRGRSYQKRPHQLKKMKKLNTYIALVPIVILAVMPPLGMYVPFTDKVAWTWLFLLFGFLGFTTFFLNISPYVKALSVLCFINVFFSKAPFISQFSYMEMISCVYLYWICRRIEDWSIVFRALEVILAMNILLLCLQSVGKDSLLNFGFYQSSCHGLVGNTMQLKSYIIVLMAILIQQFKFTRRGKFVLGASAFVIAISYFFAHRVFVSFMFARGPVWIETCILSMQHPFIGWGIGTYKAIFASISNLSAVTQGEGRWITCHNDFFQVLFEVGIPTFFIFIAYCVSLLKQCRGVLLYGALLIAFSMSVHFPMRTTQIVPLLILFVAYIERIKHGSCK